MPTAFDTGTAREIVQKVNGALNRALADEGVRSKLNGLGFEAAPMSADEFDAFVVGEIRKYTKVVRDLGLKLD